MKSRVTNTGTHSIAVRTPLGAYVEIRPGETKECFVASIEHGNGSARYSVEPAEGGQ